MQVPVTVKGQATSSSPTWPPAQLPARVPRQIHLGGVHGKLGLFRSEAYVQLQHNYFMFILKFLISPFTNPSFFLAALLDMNVQVLSFHFALTKEACYATPHVSFEVSTHMIVDFELFDE